MIHVKKNRIRHNNNARFVYYTITITIALLVYVLFTCHGIFYIIIGPLLSLLPNIIIVLIAHNTLILFAQDLYTCKCVYISYKYDYIMYHFRESDCE